MKTKKNTFWSLIIAILLLLVLPSCNRYGCPAANNPVDYAALAGGQQAELDKKANKPSKSSYNQYTGQTQNKKGRVQGKRSAKKDANKRKNTKNKKPKKVDRNKL